MAEQEEVLKYKLDVTEVQAKMQVLEQMLQQLRAKKAAGEDTGALEAQISKEVDGLGRVTQKQKQASDSTEGLVRQKEKLANVVQLAGGQFSGMLGQLGGVVELLMAGGPAAAAFAAGLGAVALGTKAWRDYARAAEEAAAAQERFNDAIRSGALQKLEATAGVAEQLEAWEARSEENLKAVAEMQDRLGRDWGVSDAGAARAAPLAVATGLSVEDAARLNVLLGAKAPIENPEQARIALEQARRDRTYDELLAKAEAYRRDTAGQAARGAALAPNRGGTGAMSPEQQAFESLRQQPGGLEASGLPADMSFGNFKAGIAGGDVMAVARAMFGGKKDFLGRPVSTITQAEHQKAQKVQQAAMGWLARFVEQIAAADMGAAPAAQGEPMFNAPTAVPDGRTPIQQTINNYEYRIDQSLRPGTAFFGDPLRQVPIRPRGKNGQSRTDIKAPGA